MNCRFEPISWPSDTFLSQICTWQPSAMSLFTKCTIELSRRSSVPGLKLSPRTPILRMPNARIASAARSICSALLGKIDSNSGNFKSNSLARYVNAFRSFGKQEPPKANPGLKYVGNDLWIHTEGAANTSHFIRERNLQCVKRVAGVLDHFRSLD